MSITSIQFIFFLLLVLLVYYIVPKSKQWIVLLLSSYIFYLCGGVFPLIFILSTTITVFLAGLKMQKIKDTLETKKQQKTAMKKVLVLICLFNLGVLFLFKYYNFFAAGLNEIFCIFEYDIKTPLINIMLPLGISFYTFQAIGYCMDVYRDKIKAENNLARFALFISFFPQIVQGPISRYGDLGIQLKEHHYFDYKKFTFGAQLMLWGGFKKLVIADRLAIIVNNVFESYTDYDGTQILVAIICYSIQIYADFSGGIDIVRGAAQCMGIELPENFNRPYFGTSIAEYWRRWHMSLTGWMREYVFYPIALSKTSNKIGKWGRTHLKKGSLVSKQLPSYLPTFVTFFLIGIWHGAGWGFIVFGFYNASLIVLSMMCTPVFKKLNSFFRINTKCFSWKVWQIIRTFTILTIGKCITRASSVAAGLEMLKACGSAFHFNDIAGRMLAMGLNLQECMALAFGLTVFFIVSVIQENGMSVREKLAEQILIVRWPIYIGMTLAIIIFGVYGIGYDASQFIYRGF